MTDDDPLILDLLSRRAGVTALARGAGDPLDIAAALAPGVPPAEARDAARTVDRSADPSLADPLVHETNRGTRLAVAAVMAELSTTLADRRRWVDHADGLRADAENRPHAWRELSEVAVVLSAWTDWRAAASDLLDAVAHAALSASSTRALAEARERVVAARRRAHLADASTWLTLVPVARRDPMRRALDRLATSSLPMAASGHAPTALERVRIGVALDGEITLAVVPDGLVIEWDGDGPRPDTLHIGDRACTLLPDDTSAAARAWRCGAATTSVRLTFRRDDDEATLQLGDATR